MSYIELGVLNMVRSHKQYRLSLASIILSFFLLFMSLSCYNGGKSIINEFAGSDTALCEVTINNLGVNSNEYNYDNRKSLAYADEKSFQSICGDREIIAFLQTDGPVAGYIEGHELGSPLGYAEGRDVRYSTFSKARYAFFGKKEIIVEGRGFSPEDKNVVLCPAKFVWDITGGKLDEFIGRTITLVGDKGNCEAEIIGIYDDLNGWTGNDSELLLLGKSKIGIENLPLELCIFSGDVISQVTDASHSTIKVLSQTPKETGSFYEAFTEIYSNKVYCKYEEVNTAIKQIDFYGGIMLFMGGLLLGASLINLLTTESLLFESRIEEITIQKVVGFKSSGFWRCYSTELFLVVFGAMALAFLMSFGICRIADEVIKESLVLSPDGYIFVPSFSGIFVGSLIMLICTFLGSGLAVHKVNKIKITEVL